MNPGRPGSKCRVVTAGVRPTRETGRVHGGAPHLPEMCVAHALVAFAPFEGGGQAWGSDGWCGHWQEL